MLVSVCSGLGEIIDAGYDLIVDFREHDDDAFFLRHVGIYYPHGH